MNTHAVDRLAGRLSRRTNRLFYFVVLGIALIGSSQAATSWLGWVPLLAFLAVGAVEVGAVALSVHADHRRQIGERAVFARLLSAAVAVGGVAINLFGHQDHPGQAAFFAGMSALGYLVWLIDSGARRRDSLRAAGRLPQPRQTYALADWLATPRLVLEARRLADETPSLGRAGSLRAAQSERQAAARRAAIVAVVRRDVAASGDRLAADLAVAAIDFDAVGDGIQRAVDNGLVAGRYAEVLGQAMGAPAAVAAASEVPAVAADRTVVRVPRSDVVEAEIVPDSAQVSAGRSTGVRRLLDADARRVAVALRKAEPDITPQEAAPLVTRAPRTVREIWAKEKTGPQPVVKTGKSAADKAADARPAMGFQATEVRVEHDRARRTK